MARVPIRCTFCFYIVFNLVSNLNNEATYIHTYIHTYLIIVPFVIVKTEVKLMRYSNILRLDISDFGERTAFLYLHCYLVIG
jgi:hypothetical protein